MDRSRRGVPASGSVTTLGVFLLCGSVGAAMTGLTSSAAVVWVAIAKEQWLLLLRAQSLYLQSRCVS